MYKIHVLLWKMVHAFHLGYNCCVSNMNNPIQYEPAGHLAASFETDAATRGETFQNGDLLLWNLAIRAPYTATSSIHPQPVLLPFLAEMNSNSNVLIFEKKCLGNTGQKVWNASRFCVSSLRRGHANLLCIVPILILMNALSELEDFVE